MSDVDCVVAGAGVVGLAIARRLAESGREVLILEADVRIGSGISSRNSEVVHAGIYYAAGSLKAELCVEGKAALYRYALQRGVPHRQTGKLIVATSEAQVAELDAIRRHASLCGVNDLVRLSGREARTMEPELACVAALHSPSTGIVDSHALMLNFVGDIERAGGALAFNTEIVGGAIEGSLVRLRTCDKASGSSYDITASLLVNAAGLDAHRLCAAIDGFPTAHVPKIVFAKGNYFAASGRSPFSRLIYPVPVDGGLGVHLTFDLSEQMRFGPDVEWVEQVDYTVDPRRGSSFYEAIRRYWPGLPEGSLSPAYCGIRPKLSGAGKPAADFRIDGPETHGMTTIINLFGIESPGLTSSLAIAERVTTLAEQARSRAGA